MALRDIFNLLEHAALVEDEDGGRGNSYSLAENSVDMILSRDRPPDKPISAYNVALV